MRAAWPCMMARNFSRAAESSLAEPCSVSMKPSSAASGVRSSWLALAMKSARISSTRRNGVRSLKVIRMMSEPPSAPVASRTGVTNASNQRSSGTRSKNSTRCGSRRLVARRIASTSSGMRSAISAGSPRRKRRRNRAGRLVEGDHPPVAVEHDGGIVQSADQRLDQRLLREQGGAAARRQSAADDTQAAVTEQRSPSIAQAGGKACARGEIVFAAGHGQPVFYVFSRSISLRSGSAARTDFSCALVLRI